MFRTPNIHAEIGANTYESPLWRTVAFQLLVQRLGFANAIDRELHLLRRHLPYYESDHIFNLVFNILADGTTLTDIELLRNNENYLNALGAQRIPHHDRRRLPPPLHRGRHRNLATNLQPATTQGLATTTPRLL